MLSAKRSRNADGGKVSAPKNFIGAGVSGILMNSPRTLGRAVSAAARVPFAALLRPPSSREGLWNRLSLALMLAAAVLVVLTFRGYGVTWDEDVQNWYGNLVLNYYLSLLGEMRAPNWLLLYKYGDLYNYGAAFDLTTAVFNRFSPLGVYETRHLLNGFVGVLGLAGCWKLGRALGGPRAGFLAALFLALTPNYYGQMFNNPKDIPFAVGFAWSIYYLVRILPELPRPRMRLVAKLGVAIGLTMAVRIGGLLLLCYLGLMLCLFGLWQAIAARRLSMLIETGWTSLWHVFVPATAIAHPLEALAVFSHEIFPAKTLFDGALLSASDLPWQYLPTYIGLALPELTLALLLAAPVVAAVALFRRESWQIRPVLGRFMLGFSIVFPIAYAIADKAVLFDGMRHFIFVLPSIAAAAALVADIALRRLATLPYRQPVYAALGLYGMAHLSIMVMLHPDQYVYYNGFVGGVAGAEHRFKLDYWANSFAESVRGLENHLRKQYGADFEEREFTVAVDGPPTPARYYFPPNFRPVTQAKGADFVIGFTIADADRYLSDLPIYRVVRMGALLSVVIDHRQFLAAERATREPFGATPHHPPVSAYP